MKNDREMLELAAKAAQAAGLKVRLADEHGYYGEDKICAVLLDDSSQKIVAVWNPRDDDGDALRLAVQLDFTIEQNIAFHRSCVLASIPGQKSVFATEFFELWANDKRAATRLAIVRAAAEIGKAMP